MPANTVMDPELMWWQALVIELWITACVCMAFLARFNIDRKGYVIMSTLPVSVAFGAGIGVAVSRPAIEAIRKYSYLTENTPVDASHTSSIFRTSLIISPKFEISGILWSWSGRRLRRRTPRLVCHITATPMRLSNSYLTQPLMTYSGGTISILEKIGKTKMAAGDQFVKI